MRLPLPEVTEVTAGASGVVAGSALTVAESAP